MLRYAKVINETIKTCIVGDENGDIDFYKSIGMTELNVEQSNDGNWYLEGYAPQKSLEDLKKEKIQELKKERDIYKSNTFIREGYSLLDFEPFSCYNYHNLIRLKCGWKQEDLDKFDAENEFISKFYDDKKEEINNATSKTNLAKIDLAFKKEEKE